MAAGIQKEPLSHEEVMETGRAVEAQLAGLLTRVVPMIVE
jgi:purine-nucleoside phosphorylase